jgi:hypothetical protein
MIIKEFIRDQWSVEYEEKLNCYYIIYSIVDDRLW